MREKLGLLRSQLEELDALVDLAVDDDGEVEGVSADKVEEAIEAVEDVIPEVEDVVEEQVEDAGEVVDDEAEVEVTADVLPAPDLTVVEVKTEAPRKRHMWWG